MSVVVGVDAHKRTTLVAVDPLGCKLGQKTIATTSDAHDAGLQCALTHFGDDLLWGVEDCRSMTAPLERDLLAVGQRVVRVPAAPARTSRSWARRGIRLGAGRFACNVVELTVTGTSPTPFAHDETYVTACRFRSNPAQFLPELPAQFSTGTDTAGYGDGDCRRRPKIDPFSSTRG